MSWFRHNCAVNGHRFEERYDEIPPDDIGTIEGSPTFVLRFVEAKTKRVYVCDVCTRCGTVTTRPGDK